MAKPFGTKHAFKDQKQITDWLYTLTPKIKKFYKEIFYNENLKITKAILIKHQIAKDILQGLLKGKTEKGEELGPVPVQIICGKYDKTTKESKSKGRPRKQGNQSSRTEEKRNIKTENKRS